MRRETSKNSFLLLKELKKTLLKVLFDWIPLGQLVCSLLNRNPFSKQIKLGQTFGEKNPLRERMLKKSFYPSLLQTDESIQNRIGN